MARSLNKKYFGNRNTGSASVTTDNGIGGKGIASVTISGVWSGFTQATSTVTFSAPQLPGGVTATGTVTITAGAPTLVTILEQGSGYTSLPTVTIADSDVGAETSGTATAVFAVDTGNVGSATNQENAIIIHANTSGGGTTALVGDIIRQVSGRRYKVKTADGIKTCKLGTDDTPAPAGAYIVATASNASTYYVTKLTAHKATLVYKSGTQIFDNGTTAPWTFDSTADGRVIIENA